MADQGDWRSSIKIGQRLKRGTGGRSKTHSPVEETQERLGKNMRLSGRDVEVVMLPDYIYRGEHGMINSGCKKGLQRPVPRVN